MRQALEPLVAAHATFSATVLKVARAAKRRKSGCALTFLRGHEETLLALIADFAGVVRGRQLRNARGAIEALDAIGAAPAPTLAAATAHGD
jgi:hypothetical protein